MIILAARSAGKHQATTVGVLQVISQPGGQLKSSLHFKVEDDFGNLVYKYKHFKDQIFKKS